MNLEFLTLDTAQRVRAINEAAVHRGIGPVIMSQLANLETQINVKGGDE